MSYVHGDCILSGCTAEQNLHTCSVFLLCLLADWTVSHLADQITTAMVIHWQLPLACVGSLLHPPVATVLSACKVRTLH